MPRFSNMKVVKNYLKDHENVRVLILKDERNNNASVWGTFVYPYDYSQLSEINDSLFEEAYTKLSNTAASAIFTENSLPIIGHVGKYRVCQVTRHNNGRIIVSSGETSGVDDNIGLE